MTIAEKLTTIAENEQKVYETGYENGKIAGQQEEYDSFWDGFQQNGLRTNYDHGFINWSAETFKPKYDICPVGNAQYMFNKFTAISGDTIDLVELLNDCNVMFDTGKAASLPYFLTSSSIHRVGVIDTRGCASNDNGFAWAQNLRIIDKVILKDNGSQSSIGMFNQCTALESITIEGVFGKSISFSNSTKLNKDSIASIINALSSTTTGITITFSKTAVNNAFGINVDVPSTYPEGSEWYELRNSKPNWTISFT